MFVFVFCWFSMTFSFNSPGGFHSNRYVWRKWRRVRLEEMEEPPKKMEEWIVKQGNGGNIRKRWADRRRVSQKTNGLGTQCS